MAAIDVSKICGKIKIVKRFPDYKVQIVTEDADLDVELVDVCNYTQGKWKIVGSYADHHIKIVDRLPDFTVSCKDKIRPVKY